MSPRKRVWQAVRRCARCGQDHPRLLRREFASAGGIDGYGYWLRCPTTGDPILLKVTRRGRWDMAVNR